MNVDMMLEWAEALESGKYEQGQGRLHYMNENNELAKHCCIGVACLIFGNRVGIHRTGIMWRWGKDGVTGHSFPIPLHEELFSAGSYLLQIPEAIQLKHNLVSVTTGDPAYLNDTWGFSFEDIAACIRYTVEKYQGENRG